MGCVHLADGSEVAISESVRIPIKLTGQTIHHEVAVLPSLSVPLLIGVDLWAKLGLSLPAPPTTGRSPTHPATGGVTGGETSLTSSEDRRLQQFLEQELPQFNAIQGLTDLASHHIRLKPGPPIKQRYRPRNPAMQAVINQEVDKMEQEGVIEPSASAWSSPVVLVRKKDGNHRFCIDFRKLNAASEKDAYPLPQVAATLDRLRGARYLSTLDLKSGYWQVPLTPGSRPATAFTVPGRGLMQFRVMPFGLHSAPATFQRLLDKVLGPELEPHVLVYLDDIVIASRTFEDHLRHLAEVFRRLRGAKLRLNPEKCHFGRNRLKYLGHIIDRRGIRTDPDKVSAIANWPVPTTIRKIRQFLGVASWYRRFIGNFSTLAAPLTRLTKKNARWGWSEVEESAFRKLKQALTTAPVLACPDFGRPFLLQTDASALGLGAVLTQQHKDGERVVAYASRTLNQAERNYSATELECLAVVWGIRRMRDYLEGYKFTVLTDHQSLRWLQRLEAPSGRLGRWLFELQQYDFDIRYRKGAQNRVADALSREPEVGAVTESEGCRWLRQLRANITARPEEYPDYEIREDRVYRHLLHDLDFRETPTEEQWKLCVARDQRPEILQRLHNEPTAGHLGVAKTIARVARIYYWPGMFREIARYVRRCQTCLAHKAPQQRPIGHLHATPVNAPWQQVSIDLVGPLPRSHSGHTWLLTMQDRFTKWLEMVPLRRATSPNIVREVTRRVILRHGCPARIISDNGTQLVSRQFRQLLATFGIEHRTTPAYAPHCNPVERANRTVKTMIAQYIDQDHRDWDGRIDALQFALNTARHEATGFTPAYLNHGRELARPHPEDRGPQAPSGDPEGNQRQLEEAFELVRIQLARAFQEQERHYNLRRREWHPRVGDRVWKRDHPLSAKSEAFNAKLAPKFVGPLEIRRVWSPVIVDLRDPHGKWYRKVHVQDLKTRASKDEDAPEIGEALENEENDSGCENVAPDP